MHPRIEIVSQMAGIEPDQPISEEQIVLLVHIILHDILHYAHHLNSGKYDVKSVIERLDYLVKQDYNLK